MHGPAAKSKTLENETGFFYIATVSSSARHHPARLWRSLICAFIVANGALIAGGKVVESNFKACTDFVFEREGGFVNDPNDPGGATNLGITIATLKAWRNSTNVTVQDVQNLQKPEATRIYHARYWLESSCERLPVGVDLLVYDLAVNAGPGRSLDFLKEQFGIAPPPAPKPPDHRHYAPKNRDLAMTYVLDHITAIPVPDLMRGLCERRRTFYRASSQFSLYGTGWLKRVDLAQSLAERMWTAGPKP
jgi:lysozyme family protein